jgi:hypothetical protein
MSDDAPELRLLDALTEDYPPVLRGRKPRWQPDKANSPALWRDVRVPAWNWTREGYEELDPAELLHLDVNAAWMAPASGTELAHGPLEHTGPKPFDKLPGYWLIDTHRWPDSTIVSPLGNLAERRSTAWLPMQTVAHLVELQELGEWPDFRIHDSWTSPDRCRLVDWAKFVKEMREEALDQREEDPGYYEAVKLGYTKAIQMFLPPMPGKKIVSQVRRADWFHALNAAQAANTWRKARWISKHHIPLAAMSSVDEVTIWREDYDRLAELIRNHSKPRVRLDNTGYQLGAFKIKEK